ncbi:hypothetical protein H6758_03885 [Candidatus Nomurabacteria bacterium]|nr:hypothetical protein [Candidatus Nomurabacteria bacterium]
MAGLPTPQSKPSRFTSEQKFGFTFLLLFVVCFALFGWFYFQRQIFSPFSVQLSAQDYEDASSVIDEQIRLQSIDTDQDGLNDFEELNFYGTSPYIKDTDSDGFPDMQEVDQGTDPLCPEGEPCDITSTYVIPTGTEQLVNGVGTAQDPLTVLGVAQGQQVGTLQYTDVEAFIGDPAQIRQALLNSGKIDKETLDKISDKALIEMAKEFYNQEVEKDKPQDPTAQTATSTEPTGEQSADQGSNES